MLIVDLRSSSRGTGTTVSTMQRLKIRIQTGGTFHVISKHPVIPSLRLTQIFNACVVLIPNNQEK